jgi:hypothetical protein
MTGYDNHKKENVFAEMMHRFKSFHAEPQR